MPNPNNVKALYDELQSTYDLGSYEDFLNYLSDDKNREALRKELSEEYDVGDIAQFSEYLGFGTGPAALEQYKQQSQPRKTRYDVAQEQYEQGRQQANATPISQTAMGSVGGYGISPTGMPVRNTQGYPQANPQPQAPAKPMAPAPRAGQWSGAPTTQVPYAPTEEEGNKSFMPIEQGGDTRQAYAGRKQAKRDLWQQQSDNVESLLAASEKRDMEAGTKRTIFTDYGSEEVVTPKRSNETRELRAAQRALRNTQRIINAADNEAGFGQGLKERVFDIDNWDFGITDITDLNALKRAMDAFDKGKKLTESQQALLDAKALEMAVNVYFASDLSKGYQAGQDIAGSLPFMAEFMLGIGSAASKATSKALVKYFTKRFAKAMEKKAVNTAVRGGARVLSDLERAAVMTGTSGAVGTEADARQRMMGQVRYDEDEQGKVTYAGHTQGEDKWKARRKAATARTLTNFSEMFGEYLGFLGKGGRWLSGTKGGKFFGLDKVAGFIDNVASSEIGSFIGRIESKAQFHGAVGEMAEELFDGVTNATFVGDQTLQDVFDKENLTRTALSVGIMSMFFSGAKLGGYGVAKGFNAADMAVRTRRADRAAANAFGEQWDGVRGQLDGATAEQAADIIQGMYDSGNYTDEQLQSALNYAIDKKGNEMIERYKANNQTPQEAAAEQSYNTGYEDANTDELRSGIEKAYTDARARLVELLENDGWDGEDSVASIDENPTERQKELDNRQDVSDDIKYAIAEYVSAKSAWDGVQQRIADDAEDNAEAKRETYRPMMRKDGTIHPVTLNEVGADGQPKVVYLLDGSDVSVNPDGSINRENSSPTLTVYDPEQGKNVFLDDPYGDSGIQSIGRVLLPEDYEEQIEAERQAEVESRSNLNNQNNNMSGRIEGVPEDYTPGMVIGVVDDAGQEHEAEVVGRVRYDKGKFVPDENGMFVEYTVEGQTKIEAPSKLNSMVRWHGTAEQPQQPQQPNTATEGQAPTAQAETPTEGGNATAEQPQVEYPRDKQGNIDYDKIGDATTFATALGEEFGEDAPATLDEIIAEETAKMKKQNAVGKARIRKRLAMLEEVKAQLTPTEEAPAEAPTAEVEQPTTPTEEVATEPTAQSVEENDTEGNKPSKKALSQLEIAKRELADDAGALEILNDLEPRTLDEVAAMLLTSGKNQVKLQMSDEQVGGVVRKGFMSETGYSREEAKRYLSVFASHAKGGVSFARFGEMVEEAAREQGVQFDENDPMAGVNAALEMFGNVGRTSDINNYIADRRTAQAYDYHHAALAQADAYMREQLGVNQAEYDAWAQHMEQQAAAVNGMSEEEYYNNIILQDDERTAETDNGTLGEEGAGTLQGQQGDEIPTPATDTRGVGEDAGGEQAEVSKYEEAESAFFGFLEWTNWEYGTKYDWNSLMSFLKWANKKAKAKEQPLRKFVHEWIGDKYPPKDAAELTDKIFAALKEREEAKKAETEQTPAAGQAEGTQKTDEEWENEFQEATTLEEMGKVVIERYGFGNGWAPMPRHWRDKMVRQSVFEEGDNDTVEDLERKISNEENSLRRAAEARDNYKRQDKKREAEEDVRDREIRLKTYRDLLSDISQEQPKQGMAEGETEVGVLPFEQINAMSDEELLSWMEKDGNGDQNKAVNMDVYDVYDSRHNDEYLQHLDNTNQEIAAITSQLENGNTANNDTLIQRIADIYTDAEEEYNNGGSYSDKRTELLARMEAADAWLEDNVRGEGEKPTPTEETPKQEPKAEKQETNEPKEPKRLISDEQMDELKERLRKKLRGQLNSGIDPETLSIGLQLAVGHIERGLTKFADFAKRMIEDLGDAIRPYLKSFYNGARDFPGAEKLAEQMTPYDEVRTFDVENFDKEGPKDIIATAEQIANEQEIEKQVEQIKKPAKGNKKEDSTLSDTEQGQLDLFGTQTTNNNDNGLERPNAVRTEGGTRGQQTDSTESSVRTNGERTPQESGGTDGSGESGSVGALGQELQHGLRPNDELAEKRNTRNNHAERGKDYAPKDVDARIEANIAAIERMQQLRDAEKQATPADMAVLRKFSGWGGLGKAFDNYEYSTKLKALLGEEAYEQANLSRYSAFYTPAKITDTLWDIARALGFKGGRVLEGSAGIGNILGAMPTDMSEQSSIEAVEIDPTTGGILSLLYPDAKVNIKGFEETRVPNGSVDLAITNVPFVADMKVPKDETGDADLSSKFKRSIQDFCIAKNVRKLKEGGIGIFITSSGTLDNSDKLRSWLTNEGNADVVGAYRMHKNTFGGASVTTDIIVIRKRVNKQKSAHAIDVSGTTAVRTAKYTHSEWDDKKKDIVEKTDELTMDYNTYFVEHPEMMGGEMKFAFEKGDTYRPTSRALYPKNGVNQDNGLKEFVQSLSGKEWDKASDETASDTVEYKELGEGITEGSMFVGEDGAFYVAQQGLAVPLEINNNKVKGHTKQECFEAYTAIKDAVSEVLDYETKNAGDEGLQPLLDKLNKAYDDFVSTYGHFQKNTSISFLKNDMGFSNVRALETMTEYNDEQGNRQQRFKKGDIFSKRVVEKEAEPKPTNAKDGVIASMYKYGRIDIPYISKQIGKSEEEVKNEILESGIGFENPQSREVEVTYEYLSGNVREKLRQAQESNENGEYDQNIKALQDIIPMNIPSHLIEFSIGSSWLDPKLYSDYISDRTGINVEMTYFNGMWMPSKVNEWNADTEKNREMSISSDIVDKTVWGHEMIIAAMQNRTIEMKKVVRDRVTKSTETIADPEATRAVAAKIDEIRADFKDWARAKMQSDPAIAEQVEQVYNERFNNFVPKSIPNDFVPEYFGGATHTIKLQPHQAKAAIRATTQPLMIAHEVGAGKTYTLITAAMEMRRIGTARKPMIVVQNATVGQFVESAKTLYPNAKILTLEDAEHNKGGRLAFYSMIKYNDWDMIIIPQSTFDMIPDSEDRRIAYIKEKIDEREAALDKLREVEDSESVIKQAENEIADMEAELEEIKLQKADKQKKRDQKREAMVKKNAATRAKEALDRYVDDVEDFDQMGIDAILVDEAHNYKRLGFATAMRRGVKGIDPAYSKRAQGVFLKAQSVMERTGGKNVVFATGTPISNTAAEVWTFMRYLMPAETLREYDIYYFDDFVRNFGNLTQMLEFGTNGKFRENNRFAGYINMPELARMWSGVADTKLTDDIERERLERGEESKIPDMEGGKATDIYLPQTKALRSIMKYIKQTLDEFDKMKPREKKKNSHIPLTMYGLANRAAVDVRLILTADANAEVAGHENGEFIYGTDDPQSKTNEAVRQTLRSLEETKDYKGTVAIFADLYQNKATGFNLYEEIKRKLVEAGVPEEQVVIMKSGMDIKKKLSILDKVNSGEIRVIMGSTATLGTGVNIQERLHTLIHMDAPNRPMDYTQRNGRILRQGNIHKQMGKPVRILRFGVEDSLDVTAYQRLKTKGAIADSVMRSGQLIANSMENRTMEEEEDLFGDTVAQLSGSEYAMLKQQAEREVRKYEAKRKQYESDQTYIHNQKPRLQGQIESAKQRAAEAQAALSKIEKAGGEKKIVIGKNTFANVAAMADFFKEYNKKVNEDSERVRRSYMQEKAWRDLPMNIGGFDFNVHLEIEKSYENKGGSMSSVAKRTMTYSCEALGLKDVPVRQGLLRNAVEDIVNDVLTGNDFRERIEAAERGIARNEEALEQISKREGKPFEFAAELEEAKKRYEEYEQLMKAEMEAKEEKYAEMDAETTAIDASALSNTDEDDEDTDSDVRFRGEEEPVFYSNAMRAVENIKQERATPEQWVKMIEKQGGMKAGEDKWLGLSEWLKGSDAKTLTKGEVLDYIRANEIQVEEVEYGDYADDADFELLKEEYDQWLHENGYDYDHAQKRLIERFGDDATIAFTDAYGELAIANSEAAAALLGKEMPINETRLSYTTEGLDNKREIVLTVPTIEPWNEHDEVHFGEAGGGRAVAWVRFGETTDADGKRVLVIDEIQSKRHQEGREKGYKDTKKEAKIEQQIAEIRERLKELEKTPPPERDQKWDEEHTDLLEKRSALFDEKSDGIIPDAPFEKNWHEVAMKRMLRFAAENGYDKVAWTKGEQQAERYDLGGLIDHIDIYPHVDNITGERVEGEYEVFPVDKRGNTMMEMTEHPFSGNLTADEVLQYYGKDLGTRMMQAVDKAGKDEKSTIDGEGLRIGGEGMKGFYDQILPRFMDKYGKKWGVKTGEVELPNIGDNGLTMWSVDVTDDMRESVMRGQPLFRPKTQSREGGEEAYAGDWYDRGSVERIGEFAGYTPKQIAKMNARQEESARKQFNETAEKLHLSDNITFADSIDDVPGLTDKQRREWRRKKGWYSPQTGKIVIILGNHKSMDDVMKSILHEGVAHHGLRQMFGKHFDTFLDNVYQTASPWIRDKINDMAKKHGWDFREATEEYLAMLAEDTDFERPENQSWWKQVKDWFIDMLHKIGFKLHDAYDTITDNELRYVLWRSYENLVHPGRYNSVVEEAKDIAKQYELKVGQWDETWTIAAEEEPNATIEYGGRRIPIWATNGRRGNRADRVERTDRMGSDYNVAADGVAEDAAEYAKETEHIEQEARDNGTWMKAPNGKRSNLTEKQWVMVRTKAFKRWFGDWQNDPDNASRVVDENGEPLVVYHGTPYSFTEFEDEGDKGIFFSSIDRASWYVKGDDYPQIRKIIKPFESWDDVKAFAEKNDIEFEKADEEEYDDAYILHGEYVFSLEEALDKAQEYFDNIYGDGGIIPVFLNIRKPRYIDAKGKYAINVNQFRNRKSQDGVIVENVNDPTFDEGSDFEDTNYIVYSPNQIKSATSNNGNFDPSSDDIRFRDGDFSERDEVTARDYYERMVSGSRYQFREAVQDSMLGLRKAYEAILGGGKKFRIEEVAGNENAYLAENRMSSVNAAEQHYYFVECMKPLLEKIHEICGSDKALRQELTDYMMAKHGLERNSVFAERDAAQNPKGVVRERDYAGLTALTGLADVHDAELAAMQMVADFEAQHDVSKLWAATKKATGVTLAKIYRSGLLSKESYEQIRDQFEWYIPLQGFDETTSDEVYGYLTSRQGPYGSPIKHAEGRSSKADDPIATIGMMADMAIRQANRNEMKKLFLNFVLDHPSDLVSVNRLWLQHDDVSGDWVPVFADIEEGDTAADVERKVAAFEERMEQLAAAEPDKYKHGRNAKNIPYRVLPGNLSEHQVLVKRDGETYVLTINGNPRAAQALNGLTNPDVKVGGVVGDMMKAAEWVNHNLSAAYTTRTPDFVVSNYFRDMLYSNCMTWVKEGGNYALRFHKNFGKFNPATMRVLFGKWEKGTLDESKPIEFMFKQFMLNGGETGYTNVRDIEAHKREIARELKRQGNVPRKAWHAFGMQLDLLNRSVENCARFAAFITSQELGRSVERSIYDAKEVSVNFNKKGSGGKMVNATGQTGWGKVGSWLSGSGRLLFVFWNAGTQGMTNFMRAAKHHPGKFSAGAATMFALGAIVPLLAKAIGDDDDDENAYYNLPEYVRRSNICFRFTKEMPWITIPLPIEFRAIYGLGELGTGVITGDEHYNNWELARQMTSQVSQLLPLDMMEGGGGLHAFIPSLAKPIVEASSNKGWTGLPIYKDTPFNQKDPEFTKVYKNADKNLVAVSKWLNELTGGDDYKKGWADKVNPAQVEYVLNGYLGGWFKVPNQLMKMGETAFGAREFEWRNMMLANRLIKNGDERTANRKLQNEYFELKDEYEETKRLLKKYKNAADEGVLKYAEKLEFLNESKEYGRYIIFDEYRKEIDKLYKQMKEEEGEQRKATEEEYYSVVREMVDKVHEYEKRR